MFGPDLAFVHCRSAAATLALVGLLGVAGVLFADTDAPIPPAVRRAFVTSAEYPANLGGLAGADAKCQAAATAGGLTTNTSFVAFLSNSTTDAFCHVQGLTGERAGWCGQGALPTAAGPWVRRDGSPFAGRIDEALAPTLRVLTPVLFDETGTPLGVGESYWTGTNLSGAQNMTYSTCADWGPGAGGGDMGAAGNPWGTGPYWLDGGAGMCTTSELHLLCVEVGPALPLPPHFSAGALAFVSSSASTGSFGGLAAADALCQADAAAAQLPSPGDFRAWLSDSGTDAVDRFTYDGAWARPDGILVAASPTDLIDGTLNAPINVTAAGAYLDANWAVWTGTDDNGLASAWTCQDWTSANVADSGWIGRPNLASFHWTDTMGYPCNPSNHFYCLADVAVMLFVDGFESGNSAAWSTTVPVL